jgi:hypothetical protein
LTFPRKEFNFRCAEFKKMQLESAVLRQLSALLDL